MRKSSQHIIDVEVVTWDPSGTNDDGDQPRKRNFSAVNEFHFNSKSLEAFMGFILTRTGNSLTKISKFAWLERSTVIRGFGLFFLS